MSLARRLASPAKVEQAERLLADQAIADLMRGEPATPVRFRSPVAEAARARAADLLEEAPPTTVPALLEWAAASGVLPPEADLERYGRTRLDPADLGPGLARTLTTQPAVLRGLLGRLAAEPPEVAEAALSGPLGTRLSRDDLSGHPELTELWLIQSVTRGDMRPLQVFDEVADIRARTERSPRADEALLHLLWPRGCPPDQLVDLLDFFRTEPATPAVADWIAAQVSAVTARETPGDGWLRLAYVLAEHPILAMLPDSQARSVRNLVRIWPLVEQAQLRGPKGDVDVFGGLFTAYATTDDVTRRMLNRALPVLLVKADPLGMALRGCPQEVAAAFCARLDSRLTPPQPDVALARRVFGVLTRPEMLGQPGLHQRLTESFEQVRTWPRRDLSTLAKTLENDPGMAGPFRVWRDAHRGRVARKILGGAAGPDPPAQRQ
jgi:hypothetical protein